MTRSTTSPRLQLRELTVADCSSAYVAWPNDPHVNRFLETRHARHDAATVTDFIESVRANPDTFLFGIFTRSNDAHIGNLKIGPIRREHGVADVSLLIGARDCWGRGYAAEAIDAASRYAFADLGVAKLSASMYAPNEGSRRAFVKAGYRQEDLRRRHYVLAGERCDLVELGLIPGDLEALR